MVGRRQKNVFDGGLHFLSDLVKYENDLQMDFFYEKKQKQIREWSDKRKKKFNEMMGAKLSHYQPDCPLHKISKPSELSVCSEYSVCPF